MRNALIIALLVFSSGSTFASGGNGKDKKKADSLNYYREFLSVSKDWQAPPLQLTVLLTRYTNLVVRETDTVSFQGDFYLDGKRAYLRFGETEQLLDDSLALNVNTVTRKMTLFTGAGSLVERTGQVTGALTGKSSLESLAAKYTVPEFTVGEGMMQVRTRACVSGTALPLETLKIRYDPVRKTPAEIISLRRVALRLEETQFTRLAGEKPWLSPWLIKNGDGTFWLVKEDRVTYRYQKLAHDAGAGVPFSIADRVVRELSGEYVPAHGFERYTISSNKL